MKKTVILLLHIGYWLVFASLLLLFLGLLLPMMSRTGIRQEPPLILLHWLQLMTGMALVPGIIGFYTSYTVLFNRLLKPRKWLLFFAAFMGTTLLAALIGDLLLVLLIGPPLAFIDYEPIVAITLIIAFGAFMNGVVGLVMKGFITWFSEQRHHEALQQKTTEMELALVKAQLNPHFLFNTINNIDVLIARDPERASAYLNQLSGILRFLLYESNTEHIALAREIENLEHYIALQRIRTTNPDYIRFTLTGSPEGRQVAPLLFLPFLENAFKYATNKKIAPAIDIALHLAPGAITFTCINQFDPQQTAAEHSGLGSGLIQKRLQLLYPGKHTLTIHTAGNHYHVSLHLST